MRIVSLLTHVENMSENSNLPQSNKMSNDNYPKNFDSLYYEFPSDVLPD